MMMSLAILNIEKDWEPYEAEAMSQATHKTTDPIFSSPEAAAFRRACSVSKNADIFRHAMHYGGCIIRCYACNKLPKGVTQAEIFDQISNLMGKNPRFEAGLAALKVYIKD